MERSVQLTIDEYMALRRLIDSEKESEGAREEARRSTPQSKRRSRRKDPKLSRALKQANARGKLKNGSYRKGWDRSRVMTLAHKYRRKM